MYLLPRFCPNRHHQSWPTVRLVSRLASTGTFDAVLHGRPFDGSNTTCYLSQVGLVEFLVRCVLPYHRNQFTNAIYVMGADSAHPSSVYIYDATAKSWSAQAVSAGSFDTSSFNAILDRDTNVFCSYFLLPRGAKLMLKLDPRCSVSRRTLLSGYEIAQSCYPHFPALGRRSEGTLHQL